MSSEPLVEATDHEQKLPPSGPVTFEEFLAWCDEDTHAEWVDGEVIMMSPATDQHLRLLPAGFGAAGTARLMIEKTIGATVREAGGRWTT